MNIRTKNHLIYVPQGRAVRLTPESLKMGVAGLYSDGFTICHLVILIGKDKISYTHADFDTLNEAIEQEIEWVGEGCQKLIVHRDHRMTKHFVGRFQEAKQEQENERFVFQFHKDKSSWMCKIVEHDIVGVSIKVELKKGLFTHQVEYCTEDQAPTHFLTHPQQSQFHPVHKIEEVLCFNSISASNNQFLIFDSCHWVDIPLEEFSPHHSDMDFLNKKLDELKKAGSFFEMYAILVEWYKTALKKTDLLPDQRMILKVLILDLQNYFSLKKPEEYFVDNFKELLDEVYINFLIENEKLASQLKQASTVESISAIFHNRDYQFKEDHSLYLHSYFKELYFVYQSRKRYDANRDFYLEQQKEATKNQDQMKRLLGKGDYQELIKLFLKSLLHARMGYTTSSLELRVLYRNLGIAYMKCVEVSSAVPYIDMASELTDLYGSDEEKANFNRFLLMGEIVTIEAPTMKEEKTDSPVPSKKDELGKIFRNRCANADVAGKPYEDFQALTKRALKSGVFWDHSTNGNTALHWALLKDQFSKAVVLLKEEAEFRKENPSCKSILTISNKATPDAPAQTPVDIARQKIDSIPPELASLLGIKPKASQSRPTSPSPLRGWASNSSFSLSS